MITHLLATLPLLLGTPAVSSTGTLAGTLSNSNGTVQVVATDAHGRAVSTTSDDIGEWSLAAPRGSYTIEYSRAAGDLQTSSAPAKVKAGQTTTVDDILVGTSTFTITAADETGAAVEDFCAAAGNGWTTRNACAVDGTATVTGLVAGKFEVDTWDDSEAHLGSSTRATITPGSVTALHATMARPGHIAVHAVDAETGDPTLSGCVYALPVGQIPVAAGRGGCSGTVDYLAAGDYQLYVGTSSQGWGAQWVGPDGGVGDRAAADKITVNPTETTDVTVRLDPAGTISGVIADADTGAGIPGASVETAGGFSSADEPDDTGYYRLDGLGPYDWTLTVDGFDDATRQVSQVHVAPLDSVTQDFTLSASTTVHGTLTGQDGTLPSWETVTAYDADTLEKLASFSTNAKTGAFTVHLPPEHRVKFDYQGAFPGDSLGDEFWVGDTTDITRATVFTITDGPTMALSLTVAK